MTITQLYLVFSFIHDNDVIIDTMASQITSLTIACAAVYSGADQKKHQSSASLAFVRGIHRSPVNYPHKWPVTRKMLPFDDVIMIQLVFVQMWWHMVRLSKFNNFNKVNPCLIMSEHGSLHVEILWRKHKRLNKTWMVKATIQSAISKPTFSFCNVWLEASRVSMIYLDDPKNDGDVCDLWFWPTCLRKFEVQFNSYVAEINAHCLLQVNGLGCSCITDPADSKMELKTKIWVT